MKDHYNGKNVLVTGGAGFIGSHLVEKLIDLGANVSIAEKENADLWRLEKIKDRVKIFFVNLNDLEKVKNLMQEIKPDIVFNLMADIRVDRDLDLVNHMITNNFEPSFILMKSLIDSDIEMFVQVGTCEEYGNGTTPFVEGQKEIPVSPYSLSKIMASQLASHLGKIEGFPVVIVRPFLTYGPKQINDQLIPYTIRSLLNGEKIHTTRMEQTRDFVYVDDVVNGLLKVPLGKAGFGEIINIGSGKGVKIKEVVEKIAKLAEANFEESVILDEPYRKGETMHFYCSNEKAKNLIGWEPKRDLDDGLRETVEWCKNNLDGK